MMLLIIEIHRKQNMVDFGFFSWKERTINYDNGERQYKDKLNSLINEEIQTRNLFNNLNNIKENKENIKINTKNEIEIKQSSVNTNIVKLKEYDILIEKLNKEINDINKEIEDFMAQNNIISIDELDAASEMFKHLTKYRNIVLESYVKLRTNIESFMLEPDIEMLENCIQPCVQIMYLNDSLTKNKHRQTIYMIEK